jgi:thiamine pyrophosphate-dependent acetolactate synthase large subunit-like protein
MIRWKQAADRYPDFGRTFGNPDFVVYAKSYGIKGARVESADGLVKLRRVASAIKASRRLSVQRRPLTAVPAYRVPVSSRGSRFAVQGWRAPRSVGCDHRRQR